MAIKTDSFQSAITILESIPGPNDPFVSVEDLIDLLGDRASGGFSKGYILAILDLLDLFGALEKGESPDSWPRVRAKTDIAVYFLNSLARYFAEEVTIVRDWITERAQDSRLLPERVFAKGTQLVYCLERTRLELNPRAQPIRHEVVAQVLIKAIIPQQAEPVYLTKYDEKAGQLQLIGGRYEPVEDADLLETIRREIGEELEFNDLSFGDNYWLEERITDLEVERRVSTTCGALSSYKFSIYHAKIAQDLETFNDNLEMIHQWVTKQELLSGTTRDGRRKVSGPYLREADRILEGGLDGLPLSFELPSVSAQETNREILTYLQQELLIRQKNLAKLRIQEAQYGIDVPLHILNHIETLEQRIQELKAEISIRSK